MKSYEFCLHSAAGNRNGKKWLYGLYGLALLGHTSSRNNVNDLNGRRTKGAVLEGTSNRHRGRAGLPITGKELKKAILQL